VPVGATSTIGVLLSKPREGSFGLEGSVARFGRDSTAVWVSPTSRFVVTGRLAGQSQTGLSSLSVPWITMANEVEAQARQLSSGTSTTTDGDERAVEHGFCVGCSSRWPSIPYPNGDR